MQATSSGGQVETPYCDFAFMVGGEFIPLHRAILAARSKFFRRMLLRQWQPQVRFPSTAHSCVHSLPDCTTRATQGHMYCSSAAIHASRHATHAAPVQSSTLCLSTLNAMACHVMCQLSIISAFCASFRYVQVCTSWPCGALCIVDVDAIYILRGLLSICCRQGMCTCQKPPWLLLPDVNSHVNQDVNVNVNVNAG